MVIRKVVIEVMVISSLCYGSDDITPAVDSLISGKEAVISFQPQATSECDEESIDDNEFSVGSRIELFSLTALLKTGKLVRVTTPGQRYEESKSKKVAHKKHSASHQKTNGNADCCDCCVTCCSDCYSCFWDCCCGLQPDDLRNSYELVACKGLGFYTIR